MGAPGRAAGQRFNRRAAQIEPAREGANRWQHAARCIGHKTAALDCTGPRGKFCDRALRTSRRYRKAVKKLSARQ